MIEEELKTRKFVERAKILNKKALSTVLLTTILMVPIFMTEVKAEIIPTEKEMINEVFDISLGFEKGFVTGHWKTYQLLLYKLWKTYLIQTFQYLS